MIIFGAGQIAEIAHFYFTNDTDTPVSGFVVDDEFVNSDSFCGLPVVALSECSQVWSPLQHRAFVALSYSKVNTLKKRKFMQLAGIGYEFETYISSRATVLTNNIGSGCFILEENTVQPFTSIGSNTTLWSGNHIGHHSNIDSHCFISSHVVVSGNCSVGERSFIGVNATLANDVCIGEACVIGASTLVSKDLPNESVVVGAQSEKARFPSSKLKNF